MRGALAWSVPPRWVAERHCEAAVAVSRHDINFETNWAVALIWFGPDFRASSSLAVSAGEQSGAPVGCGMRPKPSRCESCSLATQGLVARPPED